MCPLPDHEKYKMENKLIDSGLILENAEHGVVFVVSAEGAGNVLHYSGWILFLILLTDLELFFF